MSDKIPVKIAEDIITDILIERYEKANFLVDADESLDWSLSCSKRLIANLNEGIMSVEEAVDALTPPERREAKRRCQEWLEKRKENLER